MSAGGGQADTFGGQPPYPHPLIAGVAAMMSFDPDRQLLSNFRGFNLRLKRPAPPSAHLPERPTWKCRTCSGLWPCEPAREGLMREYETDPTSIAMLMWTHLEHYAFDQGDVPLSGAFERFIAWTRRRTEA